MPTATNIASNFVEVEDIRLHYLSAGEGDPVLLLHGWPTSSYLWRNIIATLSETKQVIALDLPGFGQSDKGFEESYSFNYYDRVIDGFLKKLGISRTSLIVHDLGGPVGLMWAVRHPQKISSLVLLNTLVYPELSWAVKLFVLSTYIPGVKKWLVSPKGIASAIRFGVHNKENLTKDILNHYQKPFQTEEAQKNTHQNRSTIKPPRVQRNCRETSQF